MRIRIKPVGEKSAHSWYAAHVGEEFTVLDAESPYHYVVDTDRLICLGHTFAFVNKSDAEIVEEESLGE